MNQTISTQGIAPEIVHLEPRHAAVMHLVGPPSALPTLLGQAFEATMQQLALSGGQVAGPPFARYFGFGEQIDAEAGFPYIGTLVPTDQVHDMVLPGGRAVMATHVGPYEEIGGVWKRVESWIHARDLVQTEAPWEAYLTGPSDPGQPVTQIVFPVS
jgi:effector-binding domain-containing protein